MSISYQQVLSDLKDELDNSSEYDEEHEQQESEHEEEFLRSDDKHPDELETQEDFNKFQTRWNTDLKFKEYSESLTNSLRYNTNDVITRSLNIDSKFRINMSDMSTDFVYKLITPIKNAISVKLVSVEIPNTYYSFSPTKGNVYMRIIYPSGTTNFYDVQYTGIDNQVNLGIPAGNYIVDTISNTAPTNIINALNDSLVTINAAINAANPSLTPPINIVTDYIPYTGKMYFREANNYNFDIDFTENSPFISRDSDWGLGYYLGFQNKVYTDSWVYPAENVVNVSGPKYLLLALNPDWKIIKHQYTELSNTDRSHFYAFAKLIMKNRAVREIAQSSADNILWSNQPVNITDIRVRLLDPYEQVVDLEGMDMSVTLEFKEVVNPSLYEYIRNRHH